MDDFLFCLNFTLHEWRRPSLYGPKSEDQDRDRDSRVPRPRPRPRLWGSKTKTKTKTPRFKTKTETKTCKNGSRDVSRPRLKSRELQVWNEVSPWPMYGLADLQAGKLVKCYQYTVPQKCAFLSPSLKDTESQFLTDSDRYLSISGLAKVQKKRAILPLPSEIQTPSASGKGSLTRGYAYGPRWGPRPIPSYRLALRACGSTRMCSPEFSLKVSLCWALEQGHL